MHEVFQRALHGCKHKHQQPPNLVCTRVTQYMQQKIEKAKLHCVISIGTMEHRFEVLCKDRTGHGIRRDRVVQENLITVDGKAFCSCMKPKLLYLAICHARISLRHVHSLGCSLEYLFHLTSARKQLYPPGDMRYTGLE